jgi:hypothetical protein
MNMPSEKTAHDEQNLQIRIEAYRVAREARNLEINLFWQRSNYFLVLSSATAAGFFSLKDGKYAVPLALFGVVVAILWVAVNLGSKFWQSRWEHRLQIAENQLQPHMNLFSADWETVKKDVHQSFQFRSHGMVYRLYARMVMMKPSVSFTMTLLSVAFLGLWIALAVSAIKQ